MANSQGLKKCMCMGAEKEPEVEEPTLGQHIDDVFCFFLKVKGVHKSIFEITVLPYMAKNRRMLVVCRGIALVGHTFSS